MAGEYSIPVRELGIRRITGEYPPGLLTRRFGPVRVNPNAYKVLKDWLNGDIIGNHARARPDLLAWFRPWNGELWLYRVATDAYVDYPPGEVVKTVRMLLPDAEPIKLGNLYGRDEFIMYGAKYAEAVLGYEDGGVVKGVWVRAGDDAYTAIKIRPFYAYPRAISAVILPNQVSRRLHVGMGLVDRIRIDLDASLATLRSFNIQELFKYKVPWSVLDYLNKRGIYPDVRILEEYGYTAYGLAIALGRVFVHSSWDRREAIARYLVRLTTDPEAFIEALSKKPQA